MNEQQIIQYYISKGYSKAQAIGIVSHLKEESQFNPSAVGDDGDAYGIAQWHPDRQQRFKKWAGKDMKGSSIREQLDFVDYELKNHEKGAYKQLQQAKTVKDSLKAFASYERFAGYKDMGSPSFQKRINHANTISKKNNISFNANIMDRNDAWKKYRGELSNAKKKFSGADLVNKEEEINKRYAAEGWFGTDANGNAIGAFNDIIRESNSINQKNTQKEAESAFLLVNNLKDIIGGKKDNLGKLKPRLKYKTEGKKQYIENNSIPLSEIDKKYHPALKALIGDKESIPVQSLLTTLEAKVNLQLPKDQQIDLINHTTKQRGKDLAFENPENINGQKNTFVPTDVYVPDLAKGNEGWGVAGIKATNTYEPRKFEYDPNSNFGYQRFDELHSNPNWGISETAVQENLKQDPSISYSAATGSPGQYSATQSGTTASSFTPNGISPDDEKYKAWKKENQAQFANMNEDQMKKMYADYLETSGDTGTSVSSMFESMANAPAPTYQTYDPKSFKENIPWDSLATSAFGIISGNSMADNNLPARDEAISEGFMQFVSEMNQMSKIGLKPEEEAYAKRTLSESYSSGIQQLVNASNGNRNVVLGNLSRLDYMKQDGLLRIAIEDANKKTEGLLKYGEAMKYISENEMNRDIANNEREYQNAMLTKKTGAELASAGWKSLMDNIQYYKENKPGSANHAYKSYMMQKMFDFDPNMKDDGSGTVKGTLSYNERVKAENHAKWADNAQIGKDYMAMTAEQRQEYDKVALKFGYNENTIGLLKFMKNTGASGSVDFAKMQEASQSGDWKSVFSDTQSPQDAESKSQTQEVQNNINLTTPYEFAANEEKPLSTKSADPLFKSSAINEFMQNTKGEGAINSIPGLIPVETQSSVLSSTDAIMQKKPSSLFESIENTALENSKTKIEAENFLSGQSLRIQEIMKEQEKINNNTNQIKSLWTGE